MKKLVLVVVLISIVGVVNVNACRSYMSIGGSISGFDYASKSFNTNAVGGKVSFGFTEYTEVFNMFGTFEYCGKGFGKGARMNTNNIGCGLHFGVNPFVGLDNSYTAHLNIVGEVNWHNNNTIGSNYGIRAIFGNGGGLFIEYKYGFDYNYMKNTYTWGHNVEIGFFVNFNVGKGKIL